MHVDAPELIAYFPGLQVTHVKLCVSLPGRKYVPAAHESPNGLHVAESIGSYVCGFLSLNLPDGHVVQSNTLGLLAYFPATHSSHVYFVAAEAP